MTASNLDLSGLTDVESLIRQATACLMDVRTSTENAEADKDVAYTMCLAVQQHFEDVEFDAGTRTIHDLCLAQATLVGLIAGVEAFAYGSGQYDDLSWAALSLLKLALFLVSQELAGVRSTTESQLTPGQIAANRDARQEVPA